MASRSVTSVTISEDPIAYENTHVHAIYEQIAPHFSSTRYKPWPVIAAFLSSLPPGWVGLDSGTGNGKYLPLPAESPGRVWTIGLDRSLNLLKIAKNAGGVCREVIWANVSDQPWRKGSFDYAISIATIHHLATYERRKQAVQRLLQAVSPSHGRILIYVWAVDQDDLSKREIPVVDDLSAAEEPGKDVFVPWVLPSDTVQTRQEQVFNRYYHMFAKGELTQLVSEAAEEMGLYVGAKSERAGIHRGIDFKQNGWERSNYYVEVHCWAV
ncbi:S-adenosyl-L-methionine-dependent methyltransferase [Lentinula aciculospora]|uniref:S-adenosyl-L-methionine-dependent methyltransferase n=1 Tax=Lentinula aciculospora TaxID=153920 RepID=A0A9W9AQB1_9AGAR|nr:S-adenosyl-L-methionine-dependent methyltransferase [Lentinula aciculospora]